MKWKNGKTWVYSITYDEGFAALLDHVVPLHRRYGFPGHVAVVAGQVGAPRNVPGSSFDGMMTLGRDEIRGLRREGWGVSCHSLTHPEVITEETARREIVDSRRRLEETLGFSGPRLLRQLRHGQLSDLARSTLPRRATGRSSRSTIWSTAAGRT